MGLKPAEPQLGCKALLILRISPEPSGVAKAANDCGCCLTFEFLLLNGRSLTVQILYPQWKMECLATDFSFDEKQTVALTNFI